MVGAPHQCSLGAAAGYLSISADARASDDVIGSQALYMSSSVFNAESLNEKDALVKAANWVFTNNISEQVPYIPNFGTGCSINFGTGGAAARVDPNATSVHPSFRTGICELSCYANWDGNRGYPEVNVLMDEWANNELNPLGVSSVMTSLTVLF